MLSFANYRKNVLLESVKKAKTFADLIHLRFDLHKLDLLEALRFPKILNESFGEIDVMYEYILAELSKEDYCICNLVLDHHFDRAKQTCVDIFLSEVEDAINNNGSIETLKANIETEIQRVMDQIKQAIANDVQSGREEEEAPSDEMPTVPVAPTAPMAGVTNQPVSMTPAANVANTQDNRIVKHRGVRGWWDWLKSWASPDAWRRWSQQRKTMGKLKDLLSYGKAPDFQGSIDKAHNAAFRYENILPLKSFVESVCLEQNSIIDQHIDDLMDELIRSIHQHIDAYVNNPQQIITGTPDKDLTPKSHNGFTKEKLVQYCRDHGQPRRADIIEAGMTNRQFAKLFSINSNDGRQRLLSIGRTLSITGDKSHTNEPFFYSNLYNSIKDEFEYMKIIRSEDELNRPTSNELDSPIVDKPANSPIVDKPANSQIVDKPANSQIVDKPVTPSTPNKPMDSDESWKQTELFRSIGPEGGKKDLANQLKRLWPFVRYAFDKKSPGEKLTPERMYHAAAKLHDMKPLSVGDFVDGEDPYNDSKRTDIANQIVDILLADKQVTDPLVSTKPGHGVPTRNPDEIGSATPEISRKEAPEQIAPKYNRNPEIAAKNAYLIDDVFAILADQFGITQPPKNIIPHMLEKLLSEDPTFAQKDDKTKAMEIIKKISEERPDLGVELPPEKISASENPMEVPTESPAESPVVEEDPEAEDLKRAIQQAQGAQQESPLELKQKSQISHLQDGLVDHISQKLLSNKGIRKRLRGVDLSVEIQDFLEEKLKEKKLSDRLNDLQMWSTSRAEVRMLADEFYEKFKLGSKGNSEDDDFPDELNTDTNYDNNPDDEFVDPNEE